VTAAERIAAAAAAHGWAVEPVENLLADVVTSLKRDGSRVLVIFTLGGRRVISASVNGATVHARDRLECVLAHLEASA
jgi:hypothetical protein